MVANLMQSHFRFIMQHKKKIKVEGKESPGYMQRRKRDRVFRERRIKGVLHKKLSFYKMQSGKRPDRGIDEYT